MFIYVYVYNVNTPPPLFGGKKYLHQRLHIWNKKNLSFCLKMYNRPLKWEFMCILPCFYDPYNSYDEYHDTNDNNCND